MMNPFYSSLQNISSLVAKPVTRTDIVRYQGASGDFDAAHHNDNHAQQFGFEGAFSLGMLHAGILTDYVINLSPQVQLKKIIIRFKGIVNIGDILTYQAKVLNSEESQDKDEFRNEATLELQVTNQKGAKVLVGSAILSLPSKSNTGSKIL